MRHRTRRKLFTVGAIVAALALFGAACGDDDDGGSSSSDDSGAEDVDAPEGRDEQDPGFDDLQAGEDFGAGGGEEEATDDEEEADEGEEADEEEAGDEEAGADDEEAAPDEYEDYIEIEDDTGALTLSVPEEWDDINTDLVPTDPETGSQGGVGLAASPDLEAYAEFYDAPGVTVGADLYDGELDQDEVITSQLEGNAEIFQFADGCSFDDTYEYEDGFYTGVFDIYENCGGDDEAGAVVLVAFSPDDEYFITFVAQVLNDADLEALDEIVLSSLYAP